MSWLERITDSMDMSVSKLREIVEDRGAWHAMVHGVTKSGAQLRDWTVTNSLGEYAPLCLWEYWLSISTSWSINLFRVCAFLRTGCPWGSFLELTFLWWWFHFLWGHFKEQNLPPLSFERHPGSVPKVSKGGQHLNQLENECSLHLACWWICMFGRQDLDARR